MCLLGEVHLSLDYCIDLGEMKFKSDTSYIEPTAYNS